MPKNYWPFKQKSLRFARSCAYVKKSNKNSSLSAIVTISLNNE
jgi:hypothetical protein